MFNKLVNSSQRFHIATGVYINLNLLKNRKHIAIMVTADGTRIPHVTTAIFWKSYRKKKYIIIKSLKIIRALNVVNAIPQLQVSLQL